MLMSDADRAIGRLDAATQLLPNPDLFVAGYVRREAVYSSQIEGTQASLTDLLEFEADAAAAGVAGDVQEVVNYVAAMNHGLTRLKELPPSIRLLNEIHAILLQGTRGGHRDPGEFRRIQNWLGPEGCTLRTATFIPPPPQELLRLMGDLESFIHDTSPIPPLVRCGLMHVQLETIHPYLDGNGRMGRLLVTFWLCWKRVLQRPLLYLSEYFKRNRSDYYDRLQKVRVLGDWEGWMEFFLEGVRVVATEAADTAGKIQAMREEHLHMVGGQTGGHAVLDQFFQSPMMTVNRVRDVMRKTYPMASQLVALMAKQGLLIEMTGQKRNRVFAYRPYLILLGEDPLPKAQSRQTPSADQELSGAGEGT